MNNSLKLIISLGLVCAIGSALLVVVRGKTEGPIRQAQELALKENLKIVLPEATDKIEAIADSNFHKALDKNGAVLAYAGQATSPIKGFGGNVKVLVGFAPDGKLLGVIVTEHSETPGLGTKATDRKLSKSLYDVLSRKVQETKCPPNAFLDAFNGISSVELLSGNRKVKNVSGATYSSKAVKAGVKAACEEFQKIMAQQK